MQPDDDEIDDDRDRGEPQVALERPAGIARDARLLPVDDLDLVIGNSGAVPKRAAQYWR